VILPITVSRDTKGKKKATKFHEGSVERGSALKNFLSEDPKEERRKDHYSPEEDLLGNAKGGRGKVQKRK